MSDEGVPIVTVCVRLTFSRTLRRARGGWLQHVSALQNSSERLRKLFVLLSLPHRRCPIFYVESLAAAHSVQTRHSRCLHATILAFRGGGCTINDRGKASRRHKTNIPFYLSMPNCIICGGAWCIRSCCPLLISHYLTPVQCKSIQVSVEFPISRVNVILPLHFALLRAFVNPRQPRLSSPSPRAPETACAATST